jgi:hypothetical protein
VIFITEGFAASRSLVLRVCGKHRRMARAKRRDWQRSDPCARENPMADWKKDLQICGAGGKSQKKAHAGRGEENKREIPVHKSTSLICKRRKPKKHLSKSGVSPKSPVD